MSGFIFLNASFRNFTFTVIAYAVVVFVKLIREVVFVKKQGSCFRIGKIRVGKIFAVVADIADTVAVRVFLDKMSGCFIVDQHTVFISKIGIRSGWAVVACVADTVAVGIILNGFAVCITADIAVFIQFCVCDMRAVILKAFNAVVVRIYERRFADIALRSFRIIVMLVGIRVVRAVVTGITDTVVVGIKLIRIAVCIEDKVVVIVFYIRVVADRISILTHNNITV